MSLLEGTPMTSPTQFSKLGTHKTHKTIKLSLSPYIM